MISFDDDATVLAKAAWILDRGLGGAMYWELSGISHLRHLDKILPCIDTRVIQETRAQGLEKAWRQGMARRRHQDQASCSWWQRGLLGIHEDWICARTGWSILHPNSKTLKMVCKSVNGKRRENSRRLRVIQRFKMYLRRSTTRRKGTVLIPNLVIYFCRQIHNDLTKTSRRGNRVDPADLDGGHLDNNYYWHPPNLRSVGCHGADQDVTVATLGMPKISTAATQLRIDEYHAGNSGLPETP